MTALQLSLGARHRNRQLFSDYYLDELLNARVYSLFDLTPDEIETIETATKYAYGEV